MAKLQRKDVEAIYELFDEFALEDQRGYYKTVVNRYRKSAFQVNVYRAIFSLLSGIASALAGLIAASYFRGGAGPNGQPICGVENASFCSSMFGAIIVLTVVSIVAPAIGGAFNTLADLFQWDRLVSVYSTALENIEVADARSPDAEMDDISYQASLVAYAEGTLSVMKDESAQWGQLIKTPAQLEKFLTDALAKAEESMPKPAGAPAASSQPVQPAAAPAPVQVAPAPVVSAQPVQPAQPVAPAPDTSLTGPGSDDTTAG